jgi:Leucine-rich repeat (LRR) protein
MKAKLISMLQYKMNTKKINEVMKKRLDEGFFGNIQEGDLIKKNLFEDDNFEPQIRELVRSGDTDNLQLAEQLALGFNINIEEIILDEWGSLLGQINYTGGLINGVKKLFRLNTLYLSDENFSELPKNLCNLHSLYKIDLSNNELTSLPEDISNLYNLEYLTLSKNGLTEIPHGVFMLNRLTELYLRQNAIQEVSPRIGELENLRILSLQDNYITTLPNEIGQLQNLEEFYFTGNEISMLPESFSNLANLRELSIGSSELDLGNLLYHLKNLKKLNELSLFRAYLDLDGYRKIAAYCDSEGIKLR